MKGPHFHTIQGIDRMGICDIMGCEMERRISTTLPIVLLVIMGLYGLRSSTGDHARAEPWPQPLSQALWAWTTNVKVSDDLGTYSQGFPAIAVDGSGNAYAVWEDYRNGAPDIYFSYRPAGGSWGTNVKVNDDPGTASQADPAIAVDASRNAYAVWHDYRNGNADIYFSYRPAGGDWETNVEVSDDPGTATQWSPAIAVDANGNAYAVWQDKRNGNWDIYFSYRPADGDWETNVEVSDDPGTATQWSPAIAVDANGNAYAVWHDYRNGDPDIYFAYRPAGGGWGTNVKVNDDVGTAEQYSPETAVDSSGNAYAVWEDKRNGDRDIYFSYRSAGGSWGGNVKVNDDLGTASQYGPAIAVDFSGNAYAVWYDFRDADADADIYFSYRSTGESWGCNVKVNDDPGTEDQRSPAIAVDSSGNGYAVWQDRRNDDSDIYFSYGLWWEPTSFAHFPIIMKNY